GAGPVSRARPRAGQPGGVIPACGRAGSRSARLRCALARRHEFDGNRSAARGSPTSPPRPSRRGSLPRRGAACARSCRPKPPPHLGLLGADRALLASDPALAPAELRLLPANRLDRLEKAVGPLEQRAVVDDAPVAADAHPHERAVDAGAQALGGFEILALTGP